MKQIISVSIGSSKRNHEVQIDLMGEEFLIKRIGTDGDIDKAIEIIKDLDGKSRCHRPRRYRLLPILQR